MRPDAVLRPRVQGNAANALLSKHGMFATCTALAETIRLFHGSASIQPRFIGELSLNSINSNYRDTMTVKPVAIAKARRFNSRHKLRSTFLRLVCLTGIALVCYAVYGLGLFSGALSFGNVSGARHISGYPTLSRVIDADTIVVGDTKVRLDGISAPERGHETYTNGKWFVADLLAEASMVECDLEGRMSHDREVGACYFIMPDGKRVDPQAEVVKAGLARDCPRYSGGRYERFETPASRALPFPSYCRP